MGHHSGVFILQRNALSRRPIHPHKNEINNNKKKKRLPLKRKIIKRNNNRRRNKNGRTNDTDAADATGDNFCSVALKMVTKSEATCLQSRQSFNSMEFPIIQYPIRLIFVF